MPMNRDDGQKNDRRGNPSRPAGQGGRPRRDGSRPPQGSPQPGRPARRASARDAALRALEDVVHADAYAAQALDRQLEAGNLKTEDRRLAASIFYFAVENRLYIEYVLDRFLQQKPEPVVNDILHIAAAQLLLMDRVPDHAAVDEAVKQVRARHRDGFAGMVNAVLRGLIRARDAGEIALPDRETDPEGWLSVKYSIAPAAVKRLAAAYGFEEAERIAAWQPPRRQMTVRPNRVRMDAAAFEAWLDERRIQWRRGIVEDAYVLEDVGSMAALDGFRRGDFSIQGQSAMLAALAVRPKPGMQVLDACAAPGGKTCLIAERMGNSGRVYAWDVHPHRVELIRAAARRLGLDNVRPSERDAREPAESLALSMDAVLVDAPCSGLGVIGEKPDIKYRQSDESLSALPPIQRDILDACCGAVKVGGRLVYATCTILPEENENQVRAFLQRHPQFAPDMDDAWVPEALKPRFDGGMLRILPHRDGIEGFFIATLTRRGI